MEKLLNGIALWSMAAGLGRVSRSVHELALSMLTGRQPVYRKRKKSIKEILLLSIPNWITAVIWEGQDDILWWEGPLYICAVCPPGLTSLCPSICICNPLLPNPVCVCVISAARICVKDMIWVRWGPFITTPFSIDWLIEFIRQTTHSNATAVRNNSQWKLGLLNQSIKLYLS